MDSHNSKATLYEQVSRIGKALASPKRLELLDLLAQGEKSVEQLAALARIDMRLTSAHLRALREARLVLTQRDGKYILYRLSGQDVASLWVTLREAAEEHLVELRVALADMVSQPASLLVESREQLLERARQGEVVVIDVRPDNEFAAGHLPFARSIPLAELAQRLGELPRDKEIVAYCRGPFCLLSDDAVSLLGAEGFRVRKIRDGVSEWAAAGLALEQEAA